MELSSIKVQIDNKLLEIGKNFEGLSDYILMLIKNRKDFGFMRTDLSVFLNGNCESFFTWLEQLVHAYNDTLNITSNITSISTHAPLSNLSSLNNSLNNIGVSSTSAHVNNKYKNDLDDEQIRLNKIKNFQKVMNSIAQSPNIQENNNKLTKHKFDDEFKSRRRTEQLKIFNHVQNLPAHDLRHQLERNKKKKQRFDRNVDRISDDSEKEFGELREKYHESVFGGAQNRVTSGFDQYNDYDHFNIHTNYIGEYSDTYAQVLHESSINKRKTTKTFGSNRKNNNSYTNDQQRIFPTNINDMNITKTRCRFWPKCANASCPYEHPSVTCRAFPACEYGRNCQFGHPVCKYNTRCKNRACAFYHDQNPSEMDPRKTDCRFGLACNKQGCPYKHNANQNTNNMLDNCTPQVRLTANPQFFDLSLDIDR